MPGAGADDLDDPARLPQRAQHVRPHHRPLDRQVRPRLQPRPRQHLRPLRREEHGTPPGEESGCCIHVRRDEEKRKCPHGERLRDEISRGESSLLIRARLPQSPSYQHTRGATPRHFQFDPSGEWLIVANQDTDNIGIFHFSLSTGWSAVTHAEWCERFDSGLREFHHLRNLADKDKYKLTKLSTELEAYNKKRICPQVSSSGRATSTTCPRPTSSAASSPSTHPPPAERLMEKLAETRPNRATAMSCTIRCQRVYHEVYSFQINLVRSKSIQGKFMLNHPNLLE